MINFIMIFVQLTNQVNELMFYYLIDIMIFLFLMDYNVKKIANIPIILLIHDF